MSIVLGFIMLNFMGALNAQSTTMQCNPSQECQQINSVLGVSHIAVGFLAFIFSLGFYLLFFNKDERVIVENYINENNKELKEETKPIKDKFSLLLRPLGDNEKKILTAIKEQEGITQSTLRYRTDLSKAKISQVLTDFEKKDLIERKAKGKTYSVFLTENF